MDHEAMFKLYQDDVPVGFMHITNNFTHILKSVGNLNLMRLLFIVILSIIAFLKASSSTKNGTSTGMRLCVP